jgi:hypothetical protein
MVDLELTELKDRIIEDINSQLAYQAFYANNRA